MNKTIASVFAAFVAGSVSLSAAVAPIADLTVESDVTFASEYNFRGYKLAHKSFQPEVQLLLGDLHAGVFANLPVSNRDHNPIPGLDRGISEIQYYLDYDFAIPQIEKIEFNIGVTAYQWHKSGLKNTYEGALRARYGNLFDIDGLSVIANYYYDITRRAHVGAGVIEYATTLNADETLGLVLAASYGKQFGGNIKDKGARVNEDYHYYGASASLPYRLTNNSSITPGVHYYTAEKAGVLGEAQVKNLFWTIGYTSSF